MTASPMRGSWQEAADVALARIPIHGVARFVGERVVAAVIIAHAVGEAHIGGAGAALIDPGIFIGRDGLGGELPADPVGFFAHDDGFAEAEGGERRADRACAAADDEDVAVSFFHGFLLSNLVGIAGLALDRCTVCFNTVRGIFRRQSE